MEVGKAERQDEVLGWVGRTLEAGGGSRNLFFTRVNSSQ